MSSRHAIDNDRLSHFACPFSEHLCNEWRSDAKRARNAKRDAPKCTSRRHRVCIFIATASSLRCENKRFSCCPCQASRFPLRALDAHAMHHAVSCTATRRTPNCLHFPVATGLSARWYWYYDRMLHRISRRRFTATFRNLMWAY